MQLLADAQSWHADTVRIDPPLTIPAGSTIDYQCEFDNTTSQFIADGPSARNNEMCVVGGLYYVPNGARMNLQDEVCFGKDIVYGGTHSCADIRTCNAAIDYSQVSATPSPLHQNELCQISGCQSANTTFDTWGNCSLTKCKTECYDFAGSTVVATKYADPACTSCDQTNCSAEASACAAQTCP
jgi:hypothetical protein